MARWTRRGWLAAAGSGLAALARSRKGEAMGQRQAAAPAAMDSGKLPLVDFQPRSMLHVPETPVPRARYPVIDVHTHVTFRSRSKAGVPLGEDVRINATPDVLLAGMDKSNLRIMVDLTGGVGAGLAKSVATFQTPHPDRFVVFTEPSYDRITDPGYPQWQAEPTGLFPQRIEPLVVDRDERS